MQDDVRTLAPTPAPSRAPIPIADDRSAGPDAAERLRAAAEAVERVRARAPRVHCLTNMAAASLSANGLLALGAVPSLTDDPGEAAAFTAGADALAVNLGTPDARRSDAIDAAVAAARAAGAPWVLDPVMVDRAPVRRAEALRLMRWKPAILRVNEDERASLFDGADAPAFAGALAVSGREDRLSRDGVTVRVFNGHALAPRITGSGCLLGALMGAVLAVERDPLQAALAATLALGVASEIAGADARGPGSFQPALLDALHALTPETVLQRGRIACDG